MAPNQAADRRARQRARVIERARDLARTGRYEDHTGIISALVGVDGYEEVRNKIEGQAIRAQLDRLCTMARNPTVTRLDLAALRSQRGA